FFFFFFHCSAALPHLHSFPTRRSSDLQPRRGSDVPEILSVILAGLEAWYNTGMSKPRQPAENLFRAVEETNLRSAQPLAALAHADRKSTRLNSSHSQISYAVFCLKKKK